MECNRVCLYFSDQCQVQNGGLRLVSMQGASADINATTDYGSQTFTQDDTSQLVTSSSVAMPINRHLAAVVAITNEPEISLATKTQGWNHLKPKLYYQWPRKIVACWS